MSQQTSAPRAPVRARRVVRAVSDYLALAVLVAATAWALVGTGVAASIWEAVSGPFR